jgi:hypothetical protein
MEIKAPESELDWPISYTLESGETIIASAWVVSPEESGGLAVKAGSPAITGSAVACIVTGGTFRQLYLLRNTITTSAGRKHSQTIAFRIGPVTPS